jgi:hypothetical protein
MPIERLPIEGVSAEQFLRDYFFPEIPVVLTGVTRGQEGQFGLDRLGAALAEPEMEKNRLWFQSATSDFPLIPIPNIVRAALSTERSLTRQKNQRLWMNARGNLTPWHSDVHGLFVFNLQLRGQKSWKLLDPNAGLPKYPFSQLALERYNMQLPEEYAHRSIEFTLHAGEMLFLPPFWDHQVLSEQEVNVNLNWVGTKRNRRVTRASERERENLALALAFRRIPVFRRAFDFLLGSKEANYLANYAGPAGGISYVVALAGGVKIRARVTRALREFTLLIRLAADYALLMRYNRDPLRQALDLKESQDAR